VSDDASKLAEAMEKFGEPVERRMPFFVALRQTGTKLTPLSLQP
jgi:hypothetical protein